MQYFTSDVKRKKRSQNVSRQTNPADENFQQTDNTKLIALLQKNFCLQVQVKQHNSRQNRLKGVYNAFLNKQCVVMRN